MKKKEKMAVLCTHCALLTQQNIQKTSLFPHVNKSVFDISRSLSFSFGDSVAYNLIRIATTVIIARIIFIRRLEIVKQFLLKY